MGLCLTCCCVIPGWILIVFGYIFTYTDELPKLKVCDVDTYTHWYIASLFFWLNMIFYCIIIGQNCRSMKNNDWETYRTFVKLNYFQEFVYGCVCALVLLKTKWQCLQGRKWGITLSGNWYVYIFIYILGCYAFIAVVRLI